MQTGRYAATFAPGFEGVIDGLLDRYLPGAANLGVTSGFASFDYKGPLTDVANLAFFNNAFLVLREWNTSASGFPDLVKASAGKSELPAFAAQISAHAGGPFRVRFSRENQFVSVDKSVMDYAEKFIARATGLHPDRFDPSIEFWYLVRREGKSIFAARISKKQSTEKYLEKGELRPEIVQLVTALARVGPEDRVLLDPFAGYGAIPEQLSRLQKGCVVYASDIDPELASHLARRFSGNSRVRVRVGDALDLSWIATASVDAIVTDPPWGFFDSDSYKGERSIEKLYAGMLASFDRVLSPRGRALVITGAKNEFRDAVLASASFAFCAEETRFRTDILINGKKSAVFELWRKGEIG
jgi:16S rRNA G966 N2-methylase RsmD